MRLVSRLAADVNAARPRSIGGSRFPASDEYTNPALFQKEKNVMEQTELNEQANNQLDSGNALPAVVPPAESDRTTSQSPQVSPATCASCGTTSASNGNGTIAPSYVFAIGRVEMRFPTLA